MSLALYCDYIYPGKTLAYALRWFREPSVGIVGGRTINLRRRRVDPDSSLDMPHLPDALTNLYMRVRYHEFEFDDLVR